MHKEQPFSIFNSLKIPVRYVTMAVRSAPGGLLPGCHHAYFSGPTMPIPMQYPNTFLVYFKLHFGLCYAGDSHRPLWLCMVKLNLCMYSKNPKIFPESV